MGRFDLSDDTVVVTTSFVTRLGLPILYVSHGDDEEGGVLWQFHCGKEDYSKDMLQRVRLDTLLRVDPSLEEIVALPIGHEARRKFKGAAWILSPKARKRA